MFFPVSKRILAKVCPAEEGQGKVAPRNFLVVAQIALSMVLLSAGGLFLQGAISASNQTPGFSLDNSVLVELDTAIVGYEEAQGREVFQRMTERLRSMPGVQSASMASIVPFGSVTSSRRVLPLGSEDQDAGIRAHRYVVGDRYFETLGLSILKGRDFSPLEVRASDGTAVVIVDEPLVEALWPGERDPVGKSIQLLSSTVGVEPQILEVVGVAPGLKHQFWDRQASAHIYLPSGQNYSANMHFHVKVDEKLGDGEAAVAFGRFATWFGR